MTKEQERAALAKIEKIVKEAGPESYIGITFDGIVEQAAENIANDFGGNYKDMWEGALIRLENRESANEALKKANADIQAELDKYKSWYEQKNNRIDELNKEISEAADDWKNLFDEREALKLENHNQKAEIITLKAKLYDLMAQ